MAQCIDVPMIVDLAGNSASLGDWNDREFDEVAAATGGTRLLKLSTSGG